MYALRMSVINKEVTNLLTYLQKYTNRYRQHEQKVNW